MAEDQAQLIYAHGQLETGAARDEIVLTRAEAPGGGGYPHTGTQRNDQYVYGDFDWNQTAASPAPGPRYVSERVHALWITPLHGRVVPSSELYGAVGVKSS